MRHTAPRPRRAEPSRAKSRSRASPCLLVDDVGAAVLGPRRLVMSHGARFFLAEADCFDLLLGHAEQAQPALDRIGALLPQRQVVFAAAAFVGIAFDHGPA